MIDIPTFDNPIDEIKFIQANKKAIEHQKKSALKFSDEINFYHDTIQKVSTEKSEEYNEVFKAESKDTDNLIQRKLVINTTNLIDSHMDMHVDGIWNKSLKETKYLPLLQEHKMSFDSIISCSEKDGMKVYTKNMNWTDLGFNFEGKTQALIFDAPISVERNKFMFDQYKKGYVRNHSVGMNYTKILFCVGNKEWATAEEYEAWEKYYPLAVNKEIADSKGYFWAVLEAKVREGSAVVMGSNYATPTLESKNEPWNDTQDKNKKEPSNDTQSKAILLLI